MRRAIGKAQASQPDWSMEFTVVKSKDVALNNGQCGHNWLKLTLPTFGNEHRAERNAGKAGKG